jgi:hypothetical protein
MLNFALNVAPSKISYMKNKHTAIWLILWVVTVVITIAVMTLLHNGEQYSAMYKMVMLSLVWAETLPFANIVIATRNPRMTDRFLPVTFASGILLSLYVLAVVVVAGMGLAEVLSTKYFIASHLVLILGLWIASVVMLAAGMHARSDEDKMAMSRSFHRGLKAEVIDICAAISSAGNPELSAAFDNYRNEVLRYSNPDSHHCVSGIEKKMTSLLEQIKKVASVVEEADFISLQASLDELTTLTKQRNEQLKSIRP